MPETKPKRPRAPRKSRAKKAPAPVVEPVVEAAPVVEAPVVDVVPPTRAELKAMIARGRKATLSAMNEAEEAVRAGNYDLAGSLLLAGVRSADVAAIASRELK